MERFNNNVDNTKKMIERQNLNKEYINNNMPSNKEENVALQAFKQPDIGRSSHGPVRSEDGKYPLNTGFKDNSFTKSKVMMSSDLGTSLIEELGVPDYDITKEEMKEEPKEENVEPSKPKKNIKGLVMKIVIIGIIIELLIALIVGLVKLIKANNSLEILECKTSVVDEKNNVTIEVLNKNYYKLDKNIKREVITKYKFKDKETYNNFQKNYVDNGIYNISGMTYENSFNTSDLSYVNKVNYDINKIKKDKNNKSNEDNKILIKDKDKDNNVLLEMNLGSYEDMKATNINDGYVCSE